MLNKQKILNLLSQYQPALKRKYPLRSIALFGSYARGEQQTDSDIDLLVEFTQPIGMEIVDLVLELEDILGQRVDVVTYNAIKDRLYYHIKDELVYAESDNSLIWKPVAANRSGEDTPLVNVT